MTITVASDPCHASTTVVATAVISNPRRASAVCGGTSAPTRASIIAFAMASLMLWVPAGVFIPGHDLPPLPRPGAPAGPAGRWHLRHSW